MLHCSILWGKDEKKILLHVHTFPCHTTTSTCHCSLCATHYPHPPSLLLPVAGTPIPGFSHHLDLSMCIFPSLPLSTPSCACSPCLYYCHSPIPHPTFSRKCSATQSHAHCPLPFPSIYFCAHKMAIPGGLLLHLPLQ